MKHVTLIILLLLCIIVIPMVWYCVIRFDQYALTTEDISQSILVDGNTKDRINIKQTTSASIDQYTDYTKSKPTSNVSYTPPEDILDFLNHPKRKFELSGQSPLDLSTIQYVMDEYRRIYSPTNKNQHIVLLSHFGNEDAVALITGALTNEYNGKRLSEYESGDLEHWAERLGILARRYTSALSFLLQGTQLSFWEAHRKWITEKREVNSRLVQSCICALGVADKPEALKYLKSFKYRPPDDYSKMICGAVVSGLFYNSMITQYGYEYFFDNVVGINSLKYIREWKKTAEGKEWYDWAETLSGIKR